MESEAKMHLFSAEVNEEAFSLLYQFLNARFAEAKAQVTGPQVGYTRTLLQDNLYRTTAASSGDGEEGTLGIPASEPFRQLCVWRGGLLAALGEGNRF